MLAEKSTGVLFVMPPGGVISFFSEHLGTAFLRAMLASAGIPSQQYLPERNVALPEFARFLAERRPAVVGFTAYETNLHTCRAMARVVREVLPGAVVMVGGPNATFSPDETLELLRADVCLRGAGEGTIVGIVQEILGADDARRRLPELLADVPNLVIRTTDGVQRTPPADLSSFPAQYFRCLDDIPSPYQAGLVTTADIGILTSRGCNQQCTYCSFAAISGRKVHFHGVERVLDDLAAFKTVVDRIERRRTNISICDDAFTLAPQRARAICEGIIERGLEMPFDCCTRADHVDADLLRLMKRAGFAAIAFGLESAAPHVLRAIGKVQDPATQDDPGFEAERAYLESVRGAVAAAKEAGLSPSVSVIGGLPAESADDFRATLAFVRSLDVSVYMHNVLMLFPGTPLYRDRERYGLEAERDTISGKWRTTHAYDVRSVPQLGNTMDRLVRWDEASRITDALCGRPREDHDSGAAWAVVFHGDVSDPRAAAWLREVLDVHGAVVVVNTLHALDVADHAAWARVLADADVPFGLLAILSREDRSSGDLVLRSIGTSGTHRFAIDRAWRSSGDVVEFDEGGHCRVRIWIASDPAGRPPMPAGAPFASTPQIADGCRWWSGWRRCRDPRVLHVSPDSTVRACWYGPALGKVGDDYREIRARGGSLRSPAEGSGAPGANRCPLGQAGEERSGDAAAAEDYEVAAQLCWILRLKDWGALNVVEEERGTHGPE